MEENQHKSISYEIYSDKKPFKLYFSICPQNLEITINNDSALSSPILKRICEIICFKSSTKYPEINYVKYR